MAGDEDERMRQVVQVSLTRVPVPQFKSDNFEGYIADIEVWQLLCGLPKSEQGIMLWYHLPTDHHSDIKAKIFNEVGTAALSSEGGVVAFLKAMNEAFKPEDEVKAYNVFVEFFMDMKRKSDEKIKDYIIRFDRLANVAKKHNMELSNTVLGLKLLHDAGLTPMDKKLVMSEINFKEKETVYKEAKSGLSKYLTDSTGLAEPTGGLKLESACVAKIEEALVAKGWHKAGPGGRGAGGGGDQLSVSQPQVISTRS